jgi:hypothetical protein
MDRSAKEDLWREKTNRKHAVAQSNIRYGALFSHERQQQPMLMDRSTFK